MKANYVAEKGVRVIRPLVYVRETLTRNFAKANLLPIINENCPACFEQPKERHRVKVSHSALFDVLRCIQIRGYPSFTFA